MSHSADERLLSEKTYDQDAALVDSGSDINLDSDVEESYAPSQLPSRRDRKVLEDAEQEEDLLRRPNRLEEVRTLSNRKSKSNARTRKRNEARSWNIKQEAEGSGSPNLIYEMESGYKDNSSRSSSESLILASEKWNQEPAARMSITRLLFIAMGLVLLLVLLTYGSYTASHQGGGILFSNGTHVFGPTTILISLDGFRADFLNRGLTPAMKAFIESGVSPKFMLPSFPSLTFPNHFTLVTGLYPESHGIVSNQFWDPRFEEEFYYTNTSSSMQPKWWNAEPLWVTAEKAGLKTAIHMWPGSEAHIDDRDPTYVDKFNGSETLDVKVKRILQWLDMPLGHRPSLIGAYVPNVDTDGHKYGPNSTQIRATIAEVDGMLTNLIEGLFLRNLTEVVNLVIVSDHGMATTSSDRLIQLDDIIDLSLVDHIDGWPLRGLRLKNPDRDVPILYDQLLKASRDGKFDVYTRETMPERYHFSTNDRIAPLWIVPKVGWAVVERNDFDVAKAKELGKQYSPLGLHGYDHEHPLMRAIFIARGPAFPHSPNSRVAVFQNIEVYNIVCDSLGIEPFRNNGTLRLPLAIEGLHSDFSESNEIPADPVDVDVEVQPQPTLTSTSPVHAETSVETTSMYSTPTTASEKETATPNNNHGQTSSATKEKHDSWWEFLHNQLEKAKDWAKELVDLIRNNQPSEDRKPT